MKTPAFWSAATPHHPLALALCPLSLLYRAVHHTRIRHITPHTLPVPVICVGNATAGGAGKTPTVIALGEMLQAAGHRPFVLSRGYKSSASGAVLVDLAKHSALEVGDEPLLIARSVPCVVAKRRLEAAQLAITSGATLLLMDDGLQNPTLHKSLTLMVIDGGFGFGNGHVLPAGPLREPLALAYAKSDGFLLIGEDLWGVRNLLPSDKPCFAAHITPAPVHAATVKDKRLVAFAGIARPEKFYHSLRELGAILIDTRDFPDHHAYTTEEIQRLLQSATTQHATLITTEKDLVRIPRIYHDQMMTLPITLTCDDALETWLRQELAHLNEITP